MRYFVDIDAEHFAVYEQTTEERRCPTCGHAIAGPFRSKLMVVLGDRDTEDGWFVVKEKDLEYMPVGPEAADAQALKFALGP